MTLKTGVKFVLAVLLNDLFFEKVTIKSNYNLLCFQVLHVFFIMISGQLHRPDIFEFVSTKAK